MSIAARRSHRGDEYQLKIAVYWLIQLFLDEDLDWVQVDSVVIPGEEELTLVDDVIIRKKNGHIICVQAKVHQTDRRAWSIYDLKEELKKAVLQMEENPSATIMFYSETPFGDFEKLVEDAPQYNDLPAFLNSAPQTLKDSFQHLSEIISISEEESIYRLCKQIKIGPYHKLLDWDNYNRADLKRVFPFSDKALPVLERIARANQTGLNSPPVLRKEDIELALRREGILPAPDLTEDEIIILFRQGSSIGRNDLPREIFGRKFDRREINEIVDVLDQGVKTILLTDGPGRGKSWILLELVDLLEAREDLGVLFIKGDRFDDVQSEADLKDLGGDIVGLAARLAAYRKVVVVIDSLDAISLSRDQKALKVFLSIIDRLEQAQNVAIVLACRDFDLSYDPLLRDREWQKTIQVTDLDYQTVASLLQKLGIDPTGISDTQKKLLCSPGNLKLLERFAGKVALESLKTSYHFLNAFVDESVLKDPSLGEEALSSLKEMAKYLFNHRSLFMHKDAFTGSQEMRRRLISAGILQEDSFRSRLGFSHQALLDTIITRDSIAGGKTLSDFILSIPPLPFIRPSVRAFFFCLRSQAPEQFAVQIKRTLSNEDIAYHLRRLIAETLAEIFPNNDDIPFFTWFLNQQRDLFRRFLWAIKGVHWFDFLVFSGLYEKLLDSSTDVHVRQDAILLLGQWINVRPTEIVSSWKVLIKTDNKTVEALFSELLHFNQWRTPGVRELLESLLELAADEAMDLLGTIISRYVEATQDGDDLLWRYITNNNTMKKDWQTSHQDEGLNCNRHNFHRKTFLQERIAKSEYLRDMALEAIEDWSSHYSSDKTENLIRNIFLYDTSWASHHEKSTMVSESAIKVLFDALEHSLRQESKNDTIWWRRIEPTIRQTKEESIAYLLILAYRCNIESNIAHIIEFLRRREVFERTSLEYEVGQLMNDAFPNFPPEYQAELQLWILNSLHQEHRSKENEKWICPEVYKYLHWIPLIFRCQEVQSFIETTKDKFGLWPQPPVIHPWGGELTAPVSVEQVLSMSDETIIKLLKFYDKNLEDRWHTDPNLVGGTNDVVWTLRECCSRHPARFASFMASIYAHGIYKKYATTLLDGVADHVRYRCGHVTPPDSWKPVEPLPQGKELGTLILKWLTSYPDCWRNAYSAASALEVCCGVIEDPDDLELLLLFMTRLSNHRDPEEVKQTIFSNSNDSIPSRDLAQVPLNSVRGKICEGTMNLAINLLKHGNELPNLLCFLLVRFSKDPHPGVKTAILMRLHLLAYHDTKLGWTLFDNVFSEPSPHLWPFADWFFYYQYTNRFDHVKAYLRKIKSEEIETALKMWGRISTLAYLSGLVDEKQLIDDLVDIKHEKAWMGAIQIFIANVSNHKTRTECEEGLLQVLGRGALPDSALTRMDPLFEKLSSEGTDRAMRIAHAYISSFSEPRELSRCHWLYDWIGFLSDRAPLAALEVCESLLERTGGTKRSIWNAGGLISAALRILREADALDDSQLISRAIALQDHLLELDFRGIKDVLDSFGRE